MADDRARDERPLYWTADQAALDNFAQKTKGESPIDGVRFSNESGIVATKKGKTK